jgi:hypothetical protein
MKRDPHGVAVDSGQIMIVADNPRFNNFSYQPNRFRVEKGSIFHIFIGMEGSRPGRIIASTVLNGYENLKHVGAFKCNSDELLVIDPCYIKFDNEEEMPYADPVFSNYYNKIMKTTDNMFGMFEYEDIIGAVTSTNYGDGVYNCFYETNENGFITTVFVEMT